MATVAKLTEQGELKIAGNIDTRLPLVTDGLVSHFPMDGRGGTFDSVGGAQSTQNTSVGVNLIEAMTLDWRDPASWLSNAGMEWDETKQALKVTGYHNTWLKTPIIVDTNKEYQVSIEVMEEEQSGTGLYLGGLCNNAEGLRVTANFDYSYAANAQPVTGVWTTYRTTRSTTSAIVSRTSTTFANNSGWTGTAQTDNLTKFYYYGGLLNYGGGGILYIKNLSIVAIDVDTSNTTITNDGIAIENATTNYLSTGLSGYTALNPAHWIGTDTLEITKDMIEVIRWDSSTGAYTYTNDLILDDDLATLSGQTVTWSLMLRRLEGSATSRIRIYDDISSYTYYTVETTKEFQKFSVTKTLGVNPTRIFVMIDNTGGGTYEWYNAQLEINPSSTEYAYYTDKLAGTLGYNIPLTEECTIQFDYFCEENISNTVISNAQANGTWWGLYHNSGGYLYTHEGNTGASHTSTFLQARNTWANITIKWTTTLQSYYADGVFLGSLSTVGSSNVTNIPILYLGWGWNRGDAKFKNVSIYNRTLSDDEILKNAKGTHSITSTGLITEKINITPVVPPSSIYFPLSFDSDNDTKYIEPTTEINTVYETNIGGVFVGITTTNLLYTPMISAADLTGGKLIKEDLGNDKVRFTTTDGTNAVFRLYCYELDLVDGDTYACSVSFLENTGTVGGDWSDTTMTYLSDSNRTIKEGTMRGTGLRADYTSTYRFLDLYCPSGTVMYNAQVEHRSYCTPFVNYDSTRGPTDLHLPYEIIDCKTDFTIYGWWYPTVHGDGVYRPCITRNIPSSNSTYNRILIMGNTTNNVLRTWAGSSGASESAQTAPGLITTNEWNFFCYRRVGTDLILTLGNSNGFGHSTDGVNEASFLDEDETGQVWQVGEYLNSESDAYHKDYVFEQSAISDEEIEAIFKTKMKAYPDELLIQNEIQTGASL